MATNKELVLEIVRGDRGGRPRGERGDLRAVPVLPRRHPLRRPQRQAGGRVPGRDPRRGSREQGRRDAEHLGLRHPTKFVRPFTEATAVINVSLIKDHSICGYTGCLKNIYRHDDQPRIPVHEHTRESADRGLYGAGRRKSRVRLHITDGFKLIYDQGPSTEPEGGASSTSRPMPSTDPKSPPDADRLGVVRRGARRTGCPRLKEASRNRRTSASRASSARASSTRIKSRCARSDVAAPRIPPA